MGHLEISAFMSLLIPIVCGGILPIFAIWMGIRKEINESKNRTQVLLSAIEKNPDVDIEELMTKISPKKKLLKEKLLNKLLAGCITSFLGIGLLGYTAYAGYVGGSNSDDIKGLCLAGIVLLGVGIALFINYYVGKKMLAKEMEAEEAQAASRNVKI